MSRHPTYGQAEEGDDDVELEALHTDADSDSENGSSGSSASDGDSHDDEAAQQRSIHTLQHQSLLGQAARQSNANAIQMGLFVAAGIAQAYIISGFLLPWTDQIFLLVVLLALITGVIKLGRDFFASLLAKSAAVFARASCQSLAIVDFALYLGASTTIGLVLILATSLFQPNPVRATLAFLFTGASLPFYAVSYRSPSRFFAGQLITHFVMWLTSTYGVFAVTSLRHRQKRGEALDRDAAEAEEAEA